MENFALILICLIAGFCLRHFKVLPKQGAHSLNVYVIYLALPAVIFQIVPELIRNLQLSKDLFIPLSMVWLQFGMCALIFFPLGRRLGWSSPTIGAIVLTAGLGNTSFVGIPLLEALYGKEALPTILLIDQTGSFLCVSTLGLFVAATTSGAKLSALKIVKRIVTFPPFIALLAAVIMSAFPRESFANLDTLFAKLGAPLVPLSLVSVGLQLELNPSTLRRRYKTLSLGLAAKLILFPLVFTLLYVFALGSHSFTTKITILESAMASMITAAILAADSHLDSELSSLMVGVGIPLSLITVPFWNWLLTLTGL